MKRECCQRLVAAPTGKGGGWAWRKSGKGRRGRRPLRGGADSFRLFSIIPKGYNHAPRRNSCRRQFMAKPIHARQGNSLAIGRSAAPGRVPCKKSEMFDYPSGFLPGQKATSPDKGRHGCAANPEGKSLHSWAGMEEIRNGTSRAPSPTRGCEPGGEGDYGVGKRDGKRKISLRGKVRRGIWDQ